MFKQKNWSKIGGLEVYCNYLTQKKKIINKGL